MSSDKTHQPGKQASAQPERPPQQFMMGSIVGMSWQMAVVVLLPLVAGHWLDTQFNTLPFITFAGLILAIAGMVVVVRRSLKDLNEYMSKTEETHSKDD